MDFAKSYKANIMKQAVMTSPGKIIFREVPVPGITENQVLIEIKRIGVCGSDVHVYHGKHPYTTYPVVQGHEVSGIIVKIGEKVNGLATGDKATFLPQVSCGRCYPCLHGDYHICDSLKVMGFQTTGAASEYFAVDAGKVIQLPKNIDLNRAALIEPLAVAAHAVQRCGDVKNKKVIVLGAGTIGNLVAQAAKGMGADKVLITDISNFRLDIAKKCGIDYAVNVSKEDLQQAILNNLGPDKADIILECVGAEQTLKQAIENARKGSDIVIVGVYGDVPKADLGLVQDRELKLTGTLMYKKEDYLKAIVLLENNKINTSPLITSFFPFDKYIDAYHFIDEKKDQCLKVLIEI